MRKWSYSTLWDHGAPKSKKRLPEVTARVVRRGECEHPVRDEPASRRYRDTSLTRNRAPLGPYCRIMPRALWWPYGGRTVSHERGTPVRPLCSGWGVGSTVRGLRGRRLKGWCQRCVSHAGLFVGVFQKSILNRFCQLGQYVPTKWLQERAKGSKNEPGIPPHRAFCGD